MSKLTDKELRLTDEQLEKILVDTNSFYDLPTEEGKQSLRDSYRKVEAEGIKQIKDAGSVEMWYLRGRC